MPLKDYGEMNVNRVEENWLRTFPQFNIYCSKFGLVRKSESDAQRWRQERLGVSIIGGFMTKKEFRICFFIASVFAALFLGFLYLKMVGY